MITVPEVCLSIHFGFRLRKCVRPVVEMRYGDCKRTSKRNLTKSIEKAESRWYLVGFEVQYRVKGIIFAFLSHITGRFNPRRLGDGRLTAEERN